MSDLTKTAASSGSPPGVLLRIPWRAISISDASAWHTNYIRWSWGALWASIVFEVPHLILCAAK
jgi:hypothetical protein